jgi:hypothetical protein
MILCVFLTVLFGFASAASANNYVGVGTCKMCHKSKRSGAQHKIWTKRAHAKAFESLATAEAKQYAAKLGFKTAPQEEKACLICHVKSKYDENGNERPASFFSRKYQADDGVQCEDCHGPGSKYRKKKTMKTITYTEGGAASSPTAKKTGLWVPDEKLCKQCHSPSVTIGGVVYKNPTFKGFDYAKRLDEIKHPIPQK